jgi:hypothetical protein
MREENRFYKYDFFLDNCTTRLRDIILKYQAKGIELPPAMPVNYTFRNAIHHYLNFNKKYWSKLGIDLLLGAKTDRVMTVAEQQFLPDNLMIALDNSKPAEIVLTKEQAYPFTPSPVKSTLFTPMIVFSILLLIYLSIQFYFVKQKKVFHYSLDFILFFLTGLLGIILLLMWFATDHSMTKNNYNLLWAMPTHLFMSFKLRNHNQWIKRYWLFTCILLAALMLSWVLLPQQLNPAFIPIIILLGIRSWFNYKS